MHTPDSTRRIVLGALLILGAAAGLAVGLLNRSGATTRWTRLPSPPEPAGQILAASEAGLWIEARSGARYFLSPLDVAAGWTVTDALNAPGALVQPALPAHVTRPALGQVLSSFDLEAEVDGRPAYVSYAIDDGGSVYRWSYSYSSGSALTILGWILVCAAAGGMLGLLALGLRWPPSRVQRGSAPGEITGELLRSPRHPPGY